MPAPLISVIVPSFNSASKLPATLNSVLEQQAGLWECIVQDGGSTDGTTDYLSQFTDPVQWVSEPDKGVYDAMNRAVAKATGSYLYFLGAGDTLRKGALSAIAPHLPADNSGFVYGDVLMADTGRRYDGEFNAAKLRTGHNICHQAIFYGRRLFELLGVYSLKYPIQADFDFNLRCIGSSVASVKYVPEIIADFEGGGVSDSRSDAAFMEDYPGLIRRHLGLANYLAYRFQMAVPSALKKRLR